MKRTVLQICNPVSNLEDHFRSYFAMSEYRLKHLHGCLATVLSAQLTIILSAQRCVCVQHYDSAFDKLAKAIKYEHPKEIQLQNSPVREIEIIPKSISH
jgi:hypothetical protein